MCNGCWVPDPECRVLKAVEIWVPASGIWVLEAGSWVPDPARWVLKHGRWGWVLQGVMLGAGCCFGERLHSGVREAAQRQAASDTYRLRPQLTGMGLRGQSGCGAMGCPGVPWSRRCQPAAGQGLRGFGDTHLTPSPLLQSVQDFHEDLFPDCTGTLPATSAQAWWAGDSQQVSVTWGGCSCQWQCQGLPLPPAHRSACQQVGRVSLHPARRPMETFSSPVIACTQLQAADTGHTDTDADRSVSTGHWGACLGVPRGQGIPATLVPHGRGRAGVPAPPAYLLSLP